MVRSENPSRHFSKGKTLRANGIHLVLIAQNTKNNYRVGVN